MPNAENDSTCGAFYAVPVVGTLGCLLVAPHPRYRHYTADPEHPDRFWTWTADDPNAVIPPGTTALSERGEDRG